MNFDTLKSIFAIWQLELAFHVSALKFRTSNETLISVEEVTFITQNSPYFFEQSPVQKADSRFGTLELRHVEYIQKAVNSNYVPAKIAFSVYVPEVHRSSSALDLCAFRLRTTCNN